MIPIFTNRENDVLAAMLASATEHGHTSHREIARRLAALAVWAMGQGGTTNGYS